MSPPLSTASPFITSAGWSRAGAIGFLKWQALQFDEAWDAEELERCAIYFRRVDLVEVLDGR